ncbi:hypothetical protein J2Z28_005490 [Paenibacillus xylanexedens]|uniref:Uncharacterized protein n=1 Tax=Paenibacillus xylanexedens TaxID=528191 RepID=A0ABS4S0Y3_PAEXY|nr:hypothetical protein [Paenibacillus xylanexedens]
MNQTLRLKTVRQPMAIFICPQVAKLYWKAKAKAMYGSCFASLV